MQVTNWTGLREPVDNCNVIVFNILKNKISKELMDIINQFLNWIDAHLWKKSILGCTECHFYFIDYNISDARVCSEQCREIAIRKSIVRSYEDAMKCINHTDDILNCNCVEDLIMQKGFNDSHDIILDEEEHRRNCSYCRNMWAEFYSDSDSDA